MTPPPPPRSQWRNVFNPTLPINRSVLRGSSPRGESVYTLVCTKCCSGWLSELPTGRCPACDGPAQMRGSYKKIPLKKDAQ